MGITPLHAQLIVREHRRRPLPATVHLLGRQTVLLTHEQAIGILKSLGVAPAEAAIEMDKQTRGGQAAQQPSSRIARFSASWE